MTTRWRPVAFLVVCGTAVTTLAVAQATPATRAELAIDLARAAGMDLPADGPSRAAADLLRRGGIDLGPDLQAPVTRGLLEQVGRAVGATVNGVRPDGPVSRATGRAFAGSIRGSLRAALARAQGGAALARISCQGRESRVGRKGIPASPADPDATEPPCDEPVP